MIVGGGEWQVSKLQRLVINKGVAATMSPGDAPVADEMHHRSPKPLLRERERGMEGGLHNCECIYLASASMQLLDLLVALSVTGNRKSLPALSCRCIRGSLLECRR